MIDIELLVCYSSGTRCRKEEALTTLMASLDRIGSRLGFPPNRSFIPNLFSSSTTYPSRVHIASWQ